MFAEKVLQTRLVVQSAVSFAARLEENILELLNHTEVGKCKSSALVMGVVSVVGHSDVIVDGGATHIDVTYVAKVMTLNIGDIVAGCKITSRQNDITMCVSEHVDAIVQNDPMFASLSVGMYVPLVVNQVVYRTMYNKITILGSFYLPKKKFSSYKITSVVPPDPAALGAIQRELESELATRDTETPVYKALVATLQAWPAEAKPAGKKLSLEDLGGLKVGDTVSRDTRADLNQMECYTGAVRESTPVSSGAAVIAIYSECLEWVRFVNQMCKVYDTPELLRDHKNLWIIMASARKQKV